MIVNILYVYLSTLLCNCVLYSYFLVGLAGFVFCAVVYVLLFSCCDFVLRRSTCPAVC